MKKEGKLYQSILWVAAVTGVILLAPLTAMQFTHEVNWTASDFIIAGVLLFGIGISYVLTTRSAPNIAYRMAMVIGLGTTLFMIWANLAVGLIGGGPNPGNLLYIAVVMVGLISVIRSRLLAANMEQAMYAMALALVFVTGIALVAGMDKYPGSSMYEILGVNGFFIVPFIIAGLLFRYVAEDESRATRKS